MDNTFFQQYYYKRKDNAHVGIVLLFMFAN